MKTFKEFITEDKKPKEIKEPWKLSKDEQLKYYKGLLDYENNQRIGDDRKIQMFKDVIKELEG